MLRGEVLPTADRPPPAYILPRLVRAFPNSPPQSVKLRMRVVTTDYRHPHASAVSGADSLPSSWETRPSVCSSIR